MNQENKSFQQQSYAYVLECSQYRDHHASNEEVWNATNVSIRKIPFEEYDKSLEISQHSKSKSFELTYFLNKNEAIKYATEKYGVKVENIEFSLYQEKNSMTIQEMYSRIQAIDAAMDEGDIPWDNEIKAKINQIENLYDSIEDLSNEIIQYDKNISLGQEEEDLEK